MKSLFLTHILRLQKIVQQTLEITRLDGLWIYAGHAKYYFLDDQTSPFKINPHFNWIFPDPCAEYSWLYVDGKNKPKIYFYAPKDYWNIAPAPPFDTFFADQFEWQLLEQAQDIQQFIANPQYCAFIGEQEDLAHQLGFKEINPRKVLNVLHFERSIKSEFEIACIQEAQKIALQGHLSAKNAFFEGKSEFEINLSYLQTTKQSDTNVPYGNIVAINQNSAILHYTKLSHISPSEKYSFLLDAGASYLGYASDITRTYAYHTDSEFAELINKIEQFKFEIISHLQIGINYLHYHTQMHQWIAQLLYDYDFVKLPADQIFEAGISRTFFPHGLGHLLGLQVHDVAGFQQNSRGTHKNAPDIYPSLRCTRELKEGMVITIEPGFYFIDILLNSWKNTPLAHYFNWQKIEYFKRFGGIRMEDNVVIRKSGAENLTSNKLIIE